MILFSLDTTFTVYFLTNVAPQLSKSLSKFAHLVRFHNKVHSNKMNQQTTDQNSTS